MHQKKKYGMYCGMMIRIENGQAHLPKDLMRKPIIGKGSKVLFLGPDGGGGMVSKVASNKKNEFMSFEHLGVVKDGIEDTESDSAEGWAGAKENYRLIDENGKTKLAVDMDSTDEFKDYFLKTWPVALEKVKELSEKN